MTSQETEPALPGVWESLVEVWVDTGLLWGQGLWLEQLGGWYVGIGPLRGGYH